MTAKKEFWQHPLQNFAVPQGIFWLSEGHLQRTLFHYFCSLGTLACSAAGILACSLGFLPVSSLEYWSKAMKPMQQKCWLYYGLGEILFVFNSRQSLLQRHKSSVAVREGQGREACCLCFSCMVYSQHCASCFPSSHSITSAQFRKILTSGPAVLWVRKGLFHHNPKITKAR